MESILDRYLGRILAVADLRDPLREAAVRGELRDHLEQKVDELRATGYSEAEALLKAIETHGRPATIGYKLRPWRLVDVRLRGTARGVIAVGPRAYGVVAIGGMAVGVVALGGLAFGAISFGGLALGLLLALGGVSGGAVAYGGAAFGVLALGGFACGAVAAGGGAAGLWVPGAGQVLASHFTAQSAPQWMHTLATWLSLETGNAAARGRFGQLMMGINAFNMVMLLIVIGVQMLLLQRERRRLTSIVGEEPCGFDLA